ncbi:ribonuclease H-like domain-containing protein [Tanacetum coccineum]
METEEVSDRFVAPFFVNGLEAYDGEINLGVEENMISNEYAVKLCLEHEVKRGNKVVKKELIVALRGEIYFVKFIINPEEDDVEPGVIFDDIPPLGEEGLSPFVCKMRKSSRNKKRAMENLNLFYQDIGTSSSAGGHLTQEEATKEAIAIRISQTFALLEKERPIIETMAYHDKYKKILDEVWKDKVELDGKIVKEEEEAVNENALADTGSNINTMPYRIYEQLGREDMKKVDRGFTMINHTQEEVMGTLPNVLCQAGVTTLIAKFLILDIPIDHDSSIVVGRGFLRTIGGIFNTPDRLFSTFDGFCHQTFRAARSDIMRNAESDSDDEEDYQIKRNKFGAPIYGPKPASKISVWKKAVSFLGSLPVPLKQVNWKPDYKGSYTKEEEAIGQWRTEIRLWEHTMMRPDHQDPNTLDNMKPWKRYCFHKFTMSSCYGKDVTEMLSLEIDDMLRIRLREAESDEEIFTLCHRNDGVLTKDMVMSLSAPIYCRDLDTTTLRDLIDSDGKLILEDPQPGVPRVGIPRPPRASMQDLYDRMGQGWRYADKYGYIKNRKKAIKNEKSRTRERKSVQEPEAKCMRTRSQARNRNRRQQQITTVIVEEPEITMADNRTMAQMLQAPIEGYEDAINYNQLDSSYNSLEYPMMQDALEFRAGENFLIRASTNAPLSTYTPSNSFEFQQLAASLEDKMDIRMSRLEKIISEKNATIPATVKAVEEVCVTCGSNYNFNNCPLTRNEFPIFHDNIHQFQQTAAVGNFVQRNPPNLANQMRPPGFNQPNVQNNQGNQSRYHGNNFNSNQNHGNNFNQNNQGQVFQPPTNQPPVYQIPPYQAPTPQIQDSASTSNSGTLLSQTVTNPRHQINAITTRRGKTLEGPLTPLVPTLVVSTPQKEPEQNPETSTEKVQNLNLENTAHVPPPEEEESIFIEIPKPKAKKTVNVEIQDLNSLRPNPYQSKLSYPERMKVRENDKPSTQHSRFLKMFKQLHLEIGLKDALVEMPKFNKWLSSLQRNKEKLEEIAIITVNAECSAIIMNKVPEKLEDPRKFLIPGDVTFLDNLLSGDASYNLASKVIFDHEPEQNESLITFSPRSDPLHHEFAGELLTLPSGNDREFGEYLSLMTMLCEILTSQSQENVHANQSSIIESLPVSPISVEDHTHTRHRTRRSGRVLLLVVGRSEG